MILLFMSGMSVKAENPVIQRDPSGKKLLLNGRIWIDNYSKVEGDQFFLTNEFVKGSVTYDGKRFDNLDLKYDLINDELILRYEPYPIIIMNKEMVDSFRLFYNGNEYRIINAGNDPSELFYGYINILYDGSAALFVKYSKKIYPLAVDGKYDLFVQVQRIYLKKGNEIIPVIGRRGFLNQLDDRKHEIRKYLRSSRIRLTTRNLTTLVRVLNFYDSMNK